ncbi:MAG: hypothetical protein ABIS20_03625 [Thermoanaerobaculia bacterium]
MRALDLPPEPRPVFSRALLTPGPLPPLSHLGLSLLRQAVESGLRYSLYHLGLPSPESSPLEEIRLRLYFDGRKLRPRLTPVPGGAEVVAALLEPGGVASRPATPRELEAALSFHRVRLAPFRLPSRRDVKPRGDATPEDLWRAFRDRFSRALPLLNDALLADLLAAVDRRALRAGNEEAWPVLSEAAWTLRTRGRGDLRCFGLPDPMAPSWAEEPDLALAARHALAPHVAPGRDRHRGRFREAYRAVLSQVSPIYRALGRAAAERGLLGDADDAFFLPLELAEHLASPHLPPWLAEAARDNRAEHQSLRKADEPLDLMDERLEMARVEAERPEWTWSPLLPLP